MLWKRSISPSSLKSQGQHLPKRDRKKIMYVTHTFSLVTNVNSWKMKSALSNVASLRCPHSSILHLPFSITRLHSYFLSLPGQNIWKKNMIKFLKITFFGIDWCQRKEKREMKKGYFFASWCPCPGPWRQREKINWKIISYGHGSQMAWSLKARTSNWRLKAP